MFFEFEAEADCVGEAVQTFSGAAFVADWGEGYTVVLRDLSGRWKTTLTLM